MVLRIATYNIHRFVGRDGIASPERIVAVLRGLNCDVTALQEVVFDTEEQGDKLSYMAQSLDLIPVDGPTLREGEGDVGNAFLTRIPPDEVDRMDISIPGREPRGALAMTFRLKKKNVAVRIVNTHLGLSSRERRSQMRRLIPLLETNSDMVAVLLGDFNEWFLWSRSLRWVHRRFGQTPAPATFPSHHPLLALDRIWVAPLNHLIYLQPYRHQPADIASDHLPLVAELAL